MISLMQMRTVIICIYIKSISILPELVVSEVNRAGKMAGDAFSVLISNEAAVRDDLGRYLPLGDCCFQGYLFLVGKNQVVSDLQISFAVLNDG